MLKALATDRFPLEAGSVEDVLICKQRRPVLETECGIRFAPAELADRFSYEYEIPRAPTFGFHGVFNMLRHVSDEDMLDLIGNISWENLASPRGVALLKNYCDLRKFSCVKAIFQRYKNHLDSPDIFNAFVRNGLHSEDAHRYVSICEMA